MNSTQFYSLGCGLTIGSAIGMIYGHEYLVSGGCFLAGIALIGVACANENRLSKSPNGVNKNIQNFNDVLWGKEKETVTLTPEQYWQISVQQNCKYKEYTGQVYYCDHGYRKKYCLFERCPWRLK
jgi:hypothetical protein